MRLALVVAALAAPLILAACGEDRGSQGTSTGAEKSTTPQATGAPAQTVDVRETEFKLDPANPSVSKPGVVELRVANAGDTVHALEVEGPAGEAKTAPIQPGKSATLKVDLSKPGRYEWYCPIADHKDEGMKGEITVGGGGAPAPSGTGTQQGSDGTSGGGGTYSP